jgi:hypothetical protein
METTFSLPETALKYHLSAKSWVSDLDFFKLENTFINGLLDDYLSRLSDALAIEKLKQIGERLTKLRDDNHYSNTVLSEQFKNLTLSGMDNAPENIADMACKQKEMEYLMTNLNSGYREVKIELFTLARTTKF